MTDEYIYIYLLILDVGNISKTVNFQLELGLMDTLIRRQVWTQL